MTHEQDKRQFIIQNIERLKSLPENWDSYGALPIREEVANAACVFLYRILEPGTPFPAVVPVNDGGIQLEWHEGGIDLEIYIRSDSHGDVSFEDAGHEDERMLADVDYIRGKLKILRERITVSQAAI